VSKIAITSPEVTPPVGLFSQAIKVGGFIYKPDAASYIDLPVAAL